MKCDFCGQENIPLLFASINTDLKIYKCPRCNHRNDVRGKLDDRL